MKIVGIGKNYVNSPEELAAVKKGGALTIFTKPESSLVKNNADIVFPSFTNDLRYEVELVLKIGKTGKDIAEQDANSYIEAIAVGIDYTAKDVLNTYREVKGPWDLAKGFDGAAPISAFKPITDFSDLNDINFGLKINNKQVQTGNTSLIIHNFATTIAFISTYMTLEPGDLIFTGTPTTGTGQIYKGDHLQASIEGEVLLDFKMV